MEQSASILIVDDEPRVIRSIQRVLEGNDYRICASNNPFKALEIMKTEQIDVIVSDNRMPELSGINLLMEAKKISPSTVRILMSAYSDFDVVITAVNDGNIFHYIVKPWNNGQLLDIINNAVQYKKEQEDKEQIIHSMLKDKEKWSDIVGQLNRKIDASNEKTVNALLKVIKVKDSDLMRHSQNVTNIALEIASAMNLSGSQREYIKLAGWFHDIGKIAIHDNILYKQGKLDLDEFAEMKHHPSVGAEILKETEFLKSISDIVLQHHERMDGEGYPGRLQGDEILLEARIIAIADTYDALVTDRVYRKGMAREAALSVLMEGSGSHYDRNIVEIFMDHVINL